MDLKEKLLSSYVTFQENLGADNDILEIKDKAIKNFEIKGFPTRKDEAWKYTSLNKLVKQDYSLFSNSVDALEFKDVKKYFIHDIDTYKIVFVDGVYSSHLSSTTHEGMDVCLLSSALTKEEYKPVINKYFDKIASEDSLTSLNTAFAKEGAYIFVPAKKIARKPIEVIHFSTGSESTLMTQPRNLIVAEEGSQVQVIERHQSLTDNATFTNSVTEIFAGSRANIDFYKIQNDRENASLIDNTHIDQKGDSEVSVHTFSFGGKLTRNNLNYYQNGEHCNSILKGITIIEDKQHVDHNTLVHHKQPNCESHQDYKGIFDNSSTGVFNGKVVVDKIAQKINAYQSNNNILVDDKATINSKPQLEIFADDVRCSHGCTIGQLDESALFYMRSRGIGKKEARALLMYAFANNVLESVRIPQLKARINKLIANKIGVSIGFEL